MKINRSYLSFLTAATVCLVAVGCQSDDLSPTSLDRTGISQDVLPGGGAADGDGAAALEEFELCKYGTTTTFDYSVLDYSSSTTTSGQLTLDDGDCVILARFGGVGANVTVTEQEPVGWDLDHVDVTVLTSSGSTTTTVSGPTVSEDVGGSAASFGLRGVLAEYYNVQEPMGGEGCTPGYWKNHAGPYSHSQGGQMKPSAWQSYSPTDSYDAVFGVSSSFGGTLIDALNRGGGGENALGRHAVAALLNAANSGVSYAYSEAQVIALVQQAYATGDFNGIKGMLASENEQGCPL